MLSIQIAGPPIGGEDRRTEAWITTVAAAASRRQLQLNFLIAGGRLVDLDNLIRPVVSGLQRAGLLARGYGDLDCLTAMKDASADGESVTVTSGLANLPAPVMLEALIDRVPPANDSDAWKQQWESNVQAQWCHDAVEGPIYLQANVHSQRSLVDLMKPVIDGLSPFVGRSPQGRLRFCPNDHLVHWLQFRRQTSGPAIAIRAGRLP